MEWQAAIETPCQENWLIVPIEMGEPPTVERDVKDSESGDREFSCKHADQEVRPTVTAPAACPDPR
jgi:hypothetical protein